MSFVRGGRNVVLVALASVFLLAITGVAPPPSAEARSVGADGSGGKAVAHRSGARAVSSPAVRAKAPDARLFRVGVNAVEPTLGVTHRGNVFYTAFQTNTRIEVVRSRNEGRTWDIVSPKFAGARNAQLVSFDPYLYVDRLEDGDNSRVFTIDLTVACSYLSFSDDEGESWTTNPLACGRPVNDHQTLFAGPPVSSPTVGYPHIVYYCWNDIATSSCSKSLDGGVTFAPTGSPPYPGLDPQAAAEGGEEDNLCGGLHGHGFVGSDGTVYLPKGHCGQPWLSISNDEGRTWRRVQVAGNGISHHEAGVAADAKGNIYYAWVARNRLPYLAVSKDGGESWTKPMMVAPPGVNETNLPGIDVGDPGKVAIVYMGTENGPGPPFADCEATLLTQCPADDSYDKTTWNGYMTISANALDKDPLFYSGTVNDKRDPLIRTNCGPGRCRAVYDFIDIVIGPEGTAWGAFVDGCIAVCTTTPPSNIGSDGIVGRLVGGPKLR